MLARQQNPKFAEATVWEYLPGTSQEFALSTNADHILYHGTRGPGKTDCQLMRFAAWVGKGYGSFWRGVIFDRKYKNLDDLIIKSKRIFKKAFGSSCKFLESKGDYKWVWDTGEELLFRQFLKPDDYWNYHGQEFPFIGWNEIAKYPNSEPYDSMTSCNRSSWTQEKDGVWIEGHGWNLPPIPLEVFSTTNPYGPGHNWVKARFIDPVPMGQIYETRVTVFHPGLGKEVEIVKKQIAIFGSYKENPYLDPKYVADLDAITDPNKRAAWLEGNWDIVAGGALDDVWRKDVHILPRFPIPEAWARVDRGLDWGSSQPCSLGWFAETNGEELILELEDGTEWRFCPPAGSLIQIGEVYRTEKLGSNKGKMESAYTIAQHVIDYELSLMNEGWIEEQPWPGPADNSIRDVRESDVDTIEKKMASKGVRWIESDKSPGSRKVGLQLMRDRLEAAMLGREDPHLYFMDNCRASIATLPTLPRDDDDLDDVDTDAEDHPYDMVRYRVLKGANRAARKIKVKWAN